MNMMMIGGLPPNHVEFCKAPDRDTAEQYEINLRGLIRLGLNVELPEASFATISRIEKDLIENHYRVMFMKLPQKTAHARFFLEHVPVKKAKK